MTVTFAQEYSNTGCHSSKASLLVPVCIMLEILAGTTVISSYKAYRDILMNILWLLTAECRKGLEN